MNAWALVAVALAVGYPIFIVVLFSWPEIRRKASKLGRQFRSRVAPQCWSCGSPIWPWQSSEREHPEWRRTHFGPCHLQGTQEYENWSPPFRPFVHILIVLLTSFMVVVLADELHPVISGLLVVGIVVWIARR